MGSRMRTLNLYNGHHVDKQVALALLYAGGLTSTSSLGGCTLLGESAGRWVACAASGKAKSMTTGCWTYGLRRRLSCSTGGGAGTASVVARTLDTLRLKSSPPER